MASSVFYPSHKSKETSVVELFCRVDVGSTGAPTLDADDSKGIASVVRNDTGDYTITLSERYNKLLMVDVMHFTDGSDVDLTWALLAHDVSAATPTVKIGFKAAATPTEVPSDDDFYVRITLKNSSV